MGTCKCQDAAYKFRDLKEELELALLHPPKEEDLDKWLIDRRQKHQFSLVDLSTDA